MLGASLTSYHGRPPGPRNAPPQPPAEEMEVSGTHLSEPPAWRLNYRIGSGSFGTVFLEKVQISGMESPELWAVKTISRTSAHFPAKCYQAEIKNLQALSNYQWFVKFNASYLDADYLYIAMEYIAIGDISRTFGRGYRWNESDTKVVIEQLLHGLAVMHKEGILHSDLKPETIFLSLPEDGTQVLHVKIGGFGVLKHTLLSNASSFLRTTAGTQDYKAPEMDDTSQPKTQSVDIWSLGCILYRMFTGSSLFNSRFGALTYTAALVSPPPAVEAVGFSVSCVGFLRDVLQPGPGDRPSAEDCLKNSWILSKAPGLEYSIGWDLYNRLSKIGLGGPNIDSFSDTVPDRAAKEMEVSNIHVGEPPAWRLNYPIGSGSFGAVFLEKIQISGMESPELWAVKRISRTSPLLPVKRYQAEIQNSQVLSNYEWFVKFYSSFEDSDYVYIAMEYIAIGDISKTFVHGYRWNEGDTRAVIEQLLHGLVVMHKEGITHRDLKPENIFLCLPEGRTQAVHVKIGDFGASKRIPPGNTSTYLKTTTGTLAYMAPEMLDTSEPKTNRVDIWSLGCILYRMFAGCLLFKDLSEVYKYTLTAPSLPPAVQDAGFSGSCVDFLRDVLQPSPEDRPSAEACFEAAWIMNKDPGSEYAIGGDLYTRLFKIKLGAPTIDTLLQGVADGWADNIQAGSPSTMETPAKTHRRVEETF